MSNIYISSFRAFFEDFPGSLTQENATPYNFHKYKILYIIKGDLILCKLMEHNLLVVEVDTLSNVNFFPLKFLCRSVNKIASE